MNTAVMGELEDWEVLQSPETGLGLSSLTPTEGVGLDSDSLTTVVGDGDSESLIRSGYFIVDSNSYIGYHDTADFDASLEPEQLVSADLALASVSEKVVSPQVMDFEGEQDYLGCGENSPKVENKDYSGSTDGLLSEQFRGHNNELGCENDLKDDVCIEANGETQGVVEVESNNDSGESLLALESEVSEMEISGGELVSGNGDGEMGNGGPESVGGDGIEPRAVDELNSGAEGNRMLIWWKLPFELLKFCVFRVSPVWTVSVAAALMGLVILKRRLSRMKAKSRSIPIKLTVDDKKVSQFMIRAKRLNEAFSVVRRVPVIRPLLPAAGVTPWPVVNLR